MQNLFFSKISLTQKELLFSLRKPKLMDALEPSQIQRIVLLIDLHPLLVSENPNPYISNILAAARRILSFSSISSSLAAFKFFFSSLSPIQSTSKLRRLLGKSPTFLSFDTPLQTLDRLSSTLGSLFSVQEPLNSDRGACPRASLVAGSLLQLEYDYAWEPQIELRKGKGKGMMHSLLIRSNLVLLFSPIPRSLDWLSEYLSEGALLSSDRLMKKFLQLFGMVKERLISRSDIHVSWVDVSFSRLGGEERFELGLFESGVKELGWGCCRTDAIVLGSALVPFGLIFPYIGYTMAFKSLSSCVKNRAELILGIKDSSGATLECKSCHLEFIVLKVVEERFDVLWLSSENCGRGCRRICIREVWEMNEVTKVIENSCVLMLLHGISRASRKEAAGNVKEEFITDKVLKLLCDEHGELDAGKPIWQLILIFLYNRNCSALVSVLDDDGGSFNGMLQPLTLNYALLSIFPKNLDVSLSAKNRANDSRRKENKAQKNLLHDVSWSSFIDRVFSQSDEFVSSIVLEELYFNLPVSRSKKLRFLKCWMKQIVKLNIFFDGERNEADNSVNGGVKEENSSSQQNSEPGSSAGDNCLSQPTSQLASSFICIEDSNAFLGSISQKIEHALCSKEVDLFNLAERLVLMSIDALYTKHGRDMAEDLNLREEQDLLDTKIANEMYNLLLEKPKDLELKCKSSTDASSTIETASIIYSNEEKIRMHELQILFRMEILLSKVASNFDKCVKLKLIKDCCLLLRNVEFYLHADFFGGESLLDYATRTIKSRYEHSLRDVIHEIYAKMEFFSFDVNEVEASDSVPASDDDALKKGDNFSMNIPNSVYMNEHNMPNQQVLDSAIEQQLLEAKERRNRARRFSSFTSWVPDLQRVWALKHPKPEKHAHETLLPKVKVKKRKRRSSIHDRVCETP